jgi:lon-related putative ATP-dependent protease
MRMASIVPLPSEALYRICDPALLPFETTADLKEDGGTFLGQERAVEAVRLATGLDGEGYNLFVVGPQGTGRRALVRRYLEEKARHAPAPADWCYVYNFAEPRKPRALKLDAGWGAMLRRDVDHLIDEVGDAIRKAFHSEDYRTRRAAAEREVTEQRAEALNEVRRHAEEKGFSIVETATGFAIVPLRDGEPIQTEELAELSEEERARLLELTGELGEELEQRLRLLPRLVRRVGERIRDLDRNVALFAVGTLVDELRKKFQRFADVSDHLRNLQDDIIEHIDVFREPAEGDGISLRQLLSGKVLSEPMRELSPKQRYGVNLIVDHGVSLGAPVVFEDEPTHPYLVGQIEHISHMGALVTDFSLIRPGALHRANGGYLVLDVRTVLSHPYAWDALKHALRACEIRTRSLGQAFGIVSTVSLEPQPIPLEVKVVLIGDRLPYYLLQAFEPEFGDLFKVVADFEEDMERSAENVQSSARQVAAVVRREKLLPLGRGAVARLIEESARHASDAERLTTESRWVADLVREAHYWAKEFDKGVVGADDVERAVAAQRRRMGRVRERIQREVLRETLLIDTEGEHVGQVNGLAVIEFGGTMFGQPHRITARAAVGSGKVIDIEREVRLGGPIHSKGVLILSSFLASSYVTDRPLSLAASLVFEQSYGAVEGDSASLAELAALLSAIAETPLRQSLAVTGSINQRGRVQAVGGVNEKIEGFFDICDARGLTGEQGVVIPAANVKHLMLRQEVVDAVKENLFAVYPVKTAHECMEILTGAEAGVRDGDGRFRAGTLNRRIADRLVELADRRRAFALQDRRDEED